MDADDLVFLTNDGEWLRLPVPDITKPNWMGNVKLMVGVHSDVNIVQLLSEASHEGSDTTHVFPRTGNAKLAVVKELLLRLLDNFAKRVLWIDDQKIDFVTHDWPRPGEVWMQPQQKNPPYERVVIGILDSLLGRSFSHPAAKGCCS